MRNTRCKRARDTVSGPVGADKPPGYVGAIVVDNNPKPEMLAMVGVRNWPTWSCKVSEFPWHYDETEMCYVIKVRWDHEGSTEPL